MSFISANAINHRNYNWKIGGSGSAPPPDERQFRLFSAYVYPIPDNTVQPTPSTVRAEYETWLKPAGTGIETFEEFETAETINNVPLLVNGITMTFVTPNEVLVTGALGQGRFNTTPGGALYVQLADDGSHYLVTFDPPINAWCAYFTDIGDFLGTVTVTLNKHGGGTMGPYTLPPAAGASSGALTFWGFSDNRLGAEHTYDSLVIACDVFADGFGIDDVNCATVAQLYP